MRYDPFRSRWCQLLEYKRNSVPIQKTARTANTARLSLAAQRTETARNPA